MYEKYIKRILDLICALLAIVFFGWFYGIIAILVRIKIGSPIIFSQFRPGKKGKDGQEKIFRMYKFRTMTNEKDENGVLLPDNIRITKFGTKLRNWSIDELPEVWNILKGEMSIVGPRPQLIRDMVFMSEEQRKRHNVRPGLSGLAQVRGRNSISWEGKLETDLEYIKRITFFGDLKIIILTVLKVFRREGISEKGMVTGLDYGDYLLKNAKISKKQYDEKLNEAMQFACFNEVGGRADGTL